MTREIVLDTETTGLKPKEGHRVVEIAAMELLNCIPTGKSYHTYVNPQRDMSSDAFKIHGLSREFLADHPPFSAIADEFLEFVGDTPLVIHNADFDMGFLNYELMECGKLPLTESICTLKMARKKFPGSPASLDALCKRFKIDISHRTKHGAMIDLGLLAKVYLNLVGGRQHGFELPGGTVGKVVAAIERTFRAPRPHSPTAEELAAHSMLLEKMKKIASPVWLMEG